MSASPLVSVALCTFNGDSYLEEQLDSIESQSRRVDEIVIGDDGSSDGTSSILERFVSRSAIAVRLLKPEGHLGVTKNFERTLAACRHRFIALSDQDDIWESDRIEKQLASLDGRADISFLFSDAALIDQYGNALPRSMFGSIRFGSGEQRSIRAGDAFPTLLRRNVATGATAMIRKELLSIATPFPSEWIHDEWLAIIGAAIGAIDFDERSLVRYRQHEGNEIGASDPTLRFRAGKLFVPRGTRNAGLAAKFNVLEERLVRLGDRVPTGYTKMAQRKAAFEGRRASLPRSRWLRFVGVAGQAIRGDYGRFASQRNFDIVRDLLQTA